MEEMKNRAFRAMSSMKRRELQRECILRGLDFKSVVSFMTPKLVGFLEDNWDNGMDDTLLTEFDVWVQKEIDLLNLPEEGKFPLFKFAAVSPTFNEELLPKPKPIVRSENKQPIELSEIGNNMRKGTKKEYTFLLVQSGKTDQAEIFKLVTQEYPDAKQSSVNAWISKAKRTIPISKP